MKSEIANRLVIDLIAEAKLRFQRASETIVEFNALMEDLRSLGYYQAPVIDGFEAVTMGESSSPRGQYFMGFYGHRDKYPIIDLKTGERITHAYMMLSYADPVEQLDRMLTEGPEAIHPYYTQSTSKSSRVKPEAKTWKETGRIRRSLGEACGWVCFYCGATGTEEVGPDARTWHVDHVYPRAKGGDDNQDNKVLSCATCNISKNKKSAIEFQRGAEYAS